MQYLNVKRCACTIGCRTEIPLVLPTHFKLVPIQRQFTGFCSAFCKLHFTKGRRRRQWLKSTLWITRWNFVTKCDVKKWWYFLLKCLINFNLISNTILMVSYLKHCDALTNNVITFQLEYTGRIEQCLFLFSWKWIIWWTGHCAGNISERQSGVREVPSNMHDQLHNLMLYILFVVNLPLELLLPWWQSH
jgi:hypothetical protein